MKALPIALLAISLAGCSTSSITTRRRANRGVALRRHGGVPLVVPITYGEQVRIQAFDGIPERP